jgi:hypothetical protein
MQRIAAVLVVAVIGVGATAGRAGACGKSSRDSSCGHYHGPMAETVTLDYAFAARWLEAPMPGPYLGTDVQGRGPVTGVGGRVRLLLGGSRKAGHPWLYGGVELEWEHVTSSPALAFVPDPPGLGTVHATTLIGVGLPIGARAELGPIEVTGELAPMMLTMFYGFRNGGQAGLAIEARAGAAVWLNPTTTLGVVAGLDVIDPRDRSLALVLGGHFDHYDTLR